MQISVKKGDPPLELPTLPTVNLPSSVSEVWATIKSFGGQSNQSVTDPAAVEEKVIIDRCAVKNASEILATVTEVTVSDPAVVVSNLHEQCHCPVGKCVHDPSNPTKNPSGV